MTYQVQIDDLVRDATSEEIAQIEARAAEVAKEKAQLEAKAIAKAALLEKLGISEEEAALLLA